MQLDKKRLREIRSAAHEHNESCRGLYEPCGEHHMHDDLCGGRPLICGRSETPMLCELLAELDARPPMVTFDMSPERMTKIAVEWPIATYGTVTLCIDTGEAFSGWAEPSDIPGRGTVCMRACGESSWLTPDDAKRLAAMLIAAANGVNAFDPGKRRTA
jgi:hypothetical protein